MTPDQHAVAELIIRYATSVDARDLDRYATCFTDDVEVTGFSGGAIKGVRPYVDWVGLALSKYSHTHHLIGNQVVDIDGDNAHMRSYVQAMHVLAAEPDTMIGLWAIYDDKVVRTADGWKIAHHHLERLIPPRRIHAPAV
jgi:3-phenylpropionate/cinnamic acid dioxygenase small subunit